MHVSREADLKPHTRRERRSGSRVTRRTAPCSALLVRPAFQGGSVMRDTRADVVVGGR
jgi:hypothetical protein